MFNSSVSGVIFTRWKRLSPASRKTIWPLYGWFTGLMSCGSFFGALHFALWTRFLVSYYQSGTDNLRTPKQFLEQAAVSRAPHTAHERSMVLTLMQFLRWLIGYLIVYPISFGFLLVAKLLVIDRLRTFAGFQDSRWLRFGRLLVFTIAALCVLGMVSNIVAAGFLAASAQSFTAAAELNSTMAVPVYADAMSKRQSGTMVGAVHLFCEFIVLLLIVSAFLIAGIACARKFAQFLPGLGQASKGHGQLNDSTGQGIQHIRRQIVCTVSVIFASLLLRLTYSVMFGVANTLNNSSISCPTFTDRCSSCFNNFTYMQVWMLYNPEFLCGVVLVSQNIALLVALWGMTSPRALSLMRNQDSNGDLSLTGSLGSSLLAGASA